MSEGIALELSLEENDRRKRRRKLAITVILISLGVHIAAGLIAGAVIIARYFAAPPAEFKATRDIRVAAQEREHKMNGRLSMARRQSPSSTTAYGASARPPSHCRSCPKFRSIRWSRSTRAR